MTGSSQKTITITPEDLKALERLAVLEAGHKILVGDFQKGRDHVDKTLDKIFEKVNSIPGKVTECKDTLEKDINDKYMSKAAGLLLEQKLTSNTKSLKLWIVSSVGGATSAGVFLLWLLKINPVV